ncbi:caspase family protein [Streptomyces sp. NPDC047043]|uniref:effector-associated domain 2-containing protein n=1 Tax=Streptomyces sp. NPDC047043 TaxID=3154497 RepID=UPI0033FBCCA5
MTPPSRTSVVVVGVESYEAGPDWDLDGPAEDARRFADWFLERDVPPERVSVLVSPLERNAAVWEQRPHPVHPADQATVHRELLRRIAGEDGELLWVVWGGHGVVDAAGHRRVFCADAVSDDRVNLDLDEALAFFRSNAVSAFRRQIWLVDACQSLPDVRRTRRRLPHSAFPAGSPTAGHDQAALFAVRAGERALNLSGERTGLFSREVLRLLADADPGLWPPDVNALYASLRHTFADLRARGLARQTPIHLWSRGWDGSEGQLLATGTPAAPAPARPSNAAVRAVAEALLAVPEWRSPAARQEMIGLVRGDIGLWAVVPEQPTPRLTAIAVVRTCLRYAGAPQELVEAARLCAGDAPEVKALSQAVDALLMSG